MDDCDRLTILEKNRVLSQSHRLKANTLIKLDKTDEALNELDKALDRARTNEKIQEEIIIERAFLELKLGRKKDALNSFQKICEINPTNEIAVTNRAALSTEIQANEVLQERLGSLADTKELNEIKDKYQNDANKHRTLSSNKVLLLFLIIVGLQILLTLFVINNYEIERITPLTFLPWLIMIAILTSPIIWSIRISIRQAEISELMTLEFTHLSYVEKRMLFYFGNDDDNFSKQLKYDYVKSTMTMSPSSKLLAVKKQKNDGNLFPSFNKLLK